MIYKQTINPRKPGDGTRLRGKIDQETRRFVNSLEFFVYLSTAGVPGPVASPVRARARVKNKHFNYDPVTFGARTRLAPFCVRFVWRVFVYKREKINYHTHTRAYACTCARMHAWQFLS